jgi:hypothetical protein
MIESWTGLLVEARQPESFAVSMERLGLTWKLWLRIGKQARERVVCDSSSENVISAWLEFCQCHPS